MTTYWFPDNTVLCNFAAVDQGQLLNDILDGRGRWVEAVAYEASRSRPMLPHLAKIIEGGWLGAPLEIRDLEDIRRIELIRRQVFGGLSGQPTKHLGEAQTCHVLRNWPEFRGSWWITDDREAFEYAAGQHLVARRTVDLMSEAIACALISRTQAWSTLLEMRSAGRHLDLPESPNQL